MPKYVLFFANAEVNTVFKFSHIQQSIFSDLAAKFFESEFADFDEFIRVAVRSGGWF